MFTNKPPCGPKRGHGTPQSRFGQEIQLDKIAESLAIDPADLRLRIVEQPDTLTANYLRVGTIGLAECIRRVTNAADWTNTFGKLPRGRGVGIACSSYLSGAGLPIYYNDMPHSGVQLEARSQRRRDGVLRRDRNRPGIRRCAGRVRRGDRSASSRSTSARSPATPI